MFLLTKIPFLQIILFLVFILLSGCAQFDRKQYEAVVIQGIKDGAGYSFQINSSPGEIVIPDGLVLDDGISEDEAIQLALINNAAFNETLSDLGVAQADYIKAGLLPNPVLSLLFPVDDRHYESSLTMAVDALWLRPRRLSIAEIQSKRIGQRLVQNGLDLVRDVRTAFAELGQSNDLSRIGLESAELQERIALLSEKRLEAGDISELETLMARIEAKSSRANAVVLQHNVEQAYQKLVTLVGLSMLEKNISFNEPSDRNLMRHDSQSLLEEALVQRPDYRAAKLAIEAAGEKTGLARMDVLKISAQVDGDEISNRFQLGPGFKLEIPLFNRNQDQIALAKAEFEKSVWQTVSIRDQIPAALFLI